MMMWRITRSCRPINVSLYLCDSDDGNDDDNNDADKEVDDGNDNGNDDGMMRRIVTMM